MPGLRDTVAELFVATVALMFKSSASARFSSYADGPTGLHVAVGDHDAPVSSGREASGSCVDGGAWTGFDSAAFATLAASATADIASSFLIRWAHAQIRARTEAPKFAPHGARKIQSGGAYNVNGRAVTLLPRGNPPLARAAGSGYLSATERDCAVRTPSIGSSIGNSGLRTQLRHWNHRRFGAYRFRARRTGARRSHHRQPRDRSTSRFCVR